jgi:hypothetical protein
MRRIGRFQSAAAITQLPALRGSIPFAVHIVEHSAIFRRREHLSTFEPGSLAGDVETNNVSGASLPSALRAEPPALPALSDSSVIVLGDARQNGAARSVAPTLDPTTGRRISPLTAAALCVKPRGQMTSRQLSIVDVLKAESEEFTTMRQLAMRFNGLFRERSVERLDEWLRDAFSCGILTMRRFAKTLRQDKSGVQNVVTEPWSHGQTEAQINRLKTLERSMYGRASTELLRARTLPLQDCNLHRV